jgi:hypothetical protein
VGGRKDRGKDTETVLLHSLLKANKNILLSW